MDEGAITVGALVAAAVITMEADGVPGIFLVYFRRNVVLVSEACG